MGSTQSELPDDRAVQASAAKALASEDMRDYAIFSLDAQGNVVSWNTGAQRIKGYTSEEIIGRHFSIFYPPDQVEAGYPDWELEQAARDGFFIDRGWRVRKDGSRFWAHVVVTATRAPDGSLYGFIKMTRDEGGVHARHQRSRRQFSDLFELASTGIALFDNDGRFLDANQALSDLLRYHLSELRTKTDRDIVHGSDPDGSGLLPSTSPLTTPGGLGEPIPHRVLARADGQPVLCEVHSKPSVSEEGGPVWLAIFNDVTEQVQHLETLRYQAMHDETTGLLNRRGFEEVTASMAEAAGGGQAAVLFCDLDNFKRINDALGHEAGDELLTAVAARLNESLPPKCTAARLYADQFVVACPDVEASGGLEALTAQVTDLFRMVVPLREWRVHVSASVGAAVLDRETSLSEVLRAGEAAMIEDRARGQGRASGALLPVQADSEQIQLEQDLREAIDEDRLGLHYQPIVDSTGHVVLAEALLRWTHPEYGRIPPDIVLRIAERGGLLADLDRSVLHRALRESSRWKGPGGRPVGVTVNVAGLHPNQVSFVDEITTALRDTGTDPDRLVIEMLETVIAELSPQARAAMGDLVDSGVRFAIDDFGTGYSSLSRLSELPAQVIKLDREFVGGICIDSTDLGITRAVAELARTMERFCIAEGVETPNQYHLLRSIGMDAYQGYLFSAPLPPADFEAFLTATPLNWTSR